MRDRIRWGIYISDFVFFSGISHAGTLISAILRTSQAGWRTPVTRMAEFITVVALMVGGLMPMIDLGRPDRIPHLFIYGRWPSPILWDFFAIATYFVGSVMYLYLPLIPDLATCRDHLAGAVSRRKQWFYRTLSIGWSGSPEQRRNLAAAIGLLLIVSIPAAVSVWGPIALLFAAAAWAVRQVVRKGAVDIAGFFAAAAARLPLPGWLHPNSA